MIKNVSEDKEKLEPLYIVMGILNDPTALENSRIVLKRLNIE